MKPNVVREYAHATDPVEAPSRDTVDAEGFYRVIPRYVDDMAAMGAKPSSEALGGRVYWFDRKVTHPAALQFQTRSYFVTDAFLATLGTGLAMAAVTAPTLHPSGLPVRGVGLHFLAPSGYRAPFAPRTHIVQPSEAQPGVRPGLPVEPLVLDGKDWDGSAVFFTEWSQGPKGEVWCGLIVSGQFLLAYETHHGHPFPCTVVKVEMEGFSAKPLRPGTPTPLPAQWSTVPTVPALVARLQSEAAGFDHFLPPVPDANEVDGALDEVAQAVSAQWSPEARALLHTLAGASLHGGAIGFFSINARAGSTALQGRHAHFGVPDDLRLAQTRTGVDEWGLTLPPGAMLFGWKTGEAPALWALTRDGDVVLLPSGGGILGPSIGITAWLYDQLEDLAYAATTQTDPATRWLGE